MNTMTRWDQPRGWTSLQDQVNRLFEGNFTLERSPEGSRTREESG
jgi:hypothetical protein